MYYLTAKSIHGTKYYAHYDVVFDSLMLTGFDEKDRVKFATKKAAEDAINGYMLLRQGLVDYKPEKI